MNDIDLSAPLNRNTSSVISCDHHHETSLKGSNDRDNSSSISQNFSFERQFLENCQINSKSFHANNNIDPVLLPMCREDMSDVDENTHEENKQCRDKNYHQIQRLDEKLPTGVSAIGDDSKFSDRAADSVEDNGESTAETVSISSLECLNDNRCKGDISGIDIVDLFSRCCDKGESSNRCSEDRDLNFGEENTNNHKIPNLSMKKKLDEDLLRLTDQNFCLTSQNKILRQSIRDVRKSTVDECSKILDSIIRYCECTANCRPPSPRKRRDVEVVACQDSVYASTCEKALRGSTGLCNCQSRLINFYAILKAASCVDTERIGAGCSTSGCGGYTPSGWNKLMTLHSLCCDNPCCPCRCDPCDDPCCCPPCSPPCPSPYPCQCPCYPPCTEVRRATRKPKITNYTGNSKLTDENESAANTRPCTKILGELAFQLERRILDYVFGMESSKRRRFYGYTVSNMSQMVDKECKNSKGEEDSMRRKLIESRITKLTNELELIGYDMMYHAEFAQRIINRYGLLACPPEPDVVEEFGLQKSRCISKLITQLARGEFEAANLQTLLRVLKYMSKSDGGHFLCGDNIIMCRTLKSIDYGYQLHKNVYKTSISWPLIY